MSSIRALWIIRDDLSEVLLSRRFPTVERRAQLLHSQHGGGREAYATIPNEVDFLAAFDPDPRNTARGFPNALRMRCGQARGRGTSQRDREAASLWPLVFIQRQDIYCAALPLLDHPPPSNVEDWDSIINIPCITNTVSLLEDIAVFALRYSPTYSTLQLADVSMLLSVAMPLGSPVDTDISRLGAIVTSGFGSAPLAYRRPAWKPYFYRGQQLIKFTLREKIRGSQYDREDVENVASVSGAIDVEAALEGMPDVTISLSHRKDKGKHLPLKTLAVHPCCTTQGDLLVSRKMAFSPPLEPFQLCHYSCRCSGANLPVRGFYQLKSISSTEVRLLLQLKLMAHVSNDFEHFDVLLPFPTRGRILSAERAPTAGSVSVTKDGKGLLWKVGAKFASHNLEVALPATVRFEDAPPPPPSPDDSVDTFCRDDTAYVKLYFRMREYTVSGLNVDSTQISIYPKTKAQVAIERYTPPTGTTNTDSNTARCTW
eukprot:TRINITY_DN5499_c0_g1_i2.p1 TRINITY_DN5499_c0_g1~~TRINITY_DN5499_c0_g1_i2.p1  ORF type:complete len:485 (+),score=88.50 TRINITY_DN5499_c0_g1_i2:307-1761(+)